MDAYMYNRNYRILLNRHPSMVDTCTKMDEDYECLDHILHALCLKHTYSIKTIY